MTQPSSHGQSGRGTSLAFVLLIFGALIAIGVWAAYTYGEGYVVIDGRTISELQPWEVAGGVIIGIVGMIVGLVGGILGLLVGIAALVISLVLGLAGVAVGLFITAGTLLGPFLLLAAIILLMRRSKAEEEALAASTRAGRSGPTSISASGRMEGFGTNPNQWL